MILRLHAKREVVKSAAIWKTLPFRQINQNQNASENLHALQHLLKNSIFIQGYQTVLLIWLDNTPEHRFWSDNTPRLAHSTMCHILLDSGFEDDQTNLNRTALFSLEKGMKTAAIFVAAPNTNKLDKEIAQKMNYPAAHDTRPSLNPFDLELTQSGISFESDPTNYETNCIIYCFREFETSGQKA
jgi:hypothetical protein